jgi:hypothetical protein
MREREKRRAVLLFLAILFVYIILFFAAPQRFCQTKRAEGHDLRAASQVKEVRDREVEWRVPNVTDLPMKKAISKLLPYTRDIRVFGSGRVVKQHPRAFERVRGEVRCVLYGEKRNEAL